MNSIPTFQESGGAFGRRGADFGLRFEKADWGLIGDTVAGCYMKWSEIQEIT
jgi:hypothetical protein